jgi:hypothetical protein
MRKIGFRIDVFLLMLHLVLIALGDKPFLVILSAVITVVFIVDWAPHEQSLLHRLKTYSALFLGLWGGAWFSVAALVHLPKLMGENVVAGGPAYWPAASIAFVVAAHWMSRWVECMASAKKG